MPTARWGYDCGPAWDAVITWLPLALYQYRGDRAHLADNAGAILRHLDYLAGKTGPDGLVSYGLGDWCPAGRQPQEYKAPVPLVNTLASMDSCAKAAAVFGILGQPARQAFAEGLRQGFRQAARTRLVDWSRMEAAGRCQTSQAMALHGGLFDPAEQAEAFRALLGIIRRDGEFLDVGVLGGRVLFHVLADRGAVDLALKMILRPEFPSYGWWVAQGATTLWEDFKRDTAAPNSMNHHFWGDISHFFLRHLAGIHYNPRLAGREADLRPQFAKALSWAEGFHRAPEGEIRVRWERVPDGVSLEARVPAGLAGVLAAPPGYLFADGLSQKPLAAGAYALRAEPA